MTRERVLNSRAQSLQGEEHLPDDVSPAFTRFQRQHMCAGRKLRERDIDQVSRTGSFCVDSPRWQLTGSSFALLRDRGA
jgi:hypothetical protein